MNRVFKVQDEVVEYVHGGYGVNVVKNVDEVWDIEWALLLDLKVVE